MPFEALRFIHASNVRVDAPLRGTGPIPDAVRRLAEDATCASFEGIISACIDRKVDFLLLTGNSFLETDQSLRARVALLRGFEQLREHGIAAYVVPGESDPAAAWKAFAHLPDNVVVFDPETDEPVAVLRDDHLIASLAAAGPQSTARENGRSGERPRRSDARPRPFSIGVISATDAATAGAADGSADRTEGATWSEPVLSTVTMMLRNRIDYLAVGGDGIRRSARTDGRMAHNPGCAQPLDASQTGAHGCSLIEVDAEGNIHCALLPTAAARWEAPVLDVAPEVTEDQLMERMQSELEVRCEPRPTEQVWFIRWTVRGSGAVFDSLADQAACEEIGELCEVDSPLPDDVRQVHRIERQVEGVPQPGTDDRLAAEYFAALEHQPPSDRAKLEHTFESAHVPEGPFAECLQNMIGKLDLDALSPMARRLGEEWFAETFEEDAA